jgi:hypothetical protein
MNSHETRVLLVPYLLGTSRFMSEGHGCRYCVYV